MEFFPNTNQAAAYTTQMNSPDRRVDQQTLDPAKKPFENFTGWRRDFWTNQTIAVLSTTFTAIAGPATAPANGAWSLAQIAAPGSSIPMQDRFGQRVTVRQTTNTEVDFAGYEMYRTGNPTGSLRVRIQGVTIDRGVTIPDGVDIAVSADVLASTLLVGSPGGLIGFFFVPGTFLTIGAQYFFILDHDYAQDGFNYVWVRHQNAFLTDGQLYHYGEGQGFDWQNYPGSVDLNQAIANPANDLVSANVVWSINGTVIGVLETSPDITDLVQAQVYMPDYTPDSGIIINLSRGLPTNVGKQMRSNQNVNSPGPVLRITYDDMLTCTRRCSSSMPPSTRILASRYNMPSILCRLFFIFQPSKDSALYRRDYIHNLAKLPSPICLTSHMPRRLRLQFIIRTRRRNDAGSV